MSESLHIVCPHCSTKNRVPYTKLDSGGKCGQCKQILFTGHPITLDEASFDHHLKHNDIPLLVDCWAPWCGPCKMMTPVFEQAAQRLEPHVRLAKLNTDQMQTVAAQLHVRSIPTLILFQHGREMARQPGAVDLGRLLRWVGQYMNTKAA